MNKTFCVLPWTHFFHTPAGEIFPCCTSESFNRNKNQYGIIRDFDDVNDIINQDSFNQLRLNMLNGVESPDCTHCYQAEKFGNESHRTTKNSMLDHMISMDEIHDMTNPDGSLNDFKMRYWDVRFSNVCNLGCRMCSPDYSHTLAKEQEVKFNGSYILKAHEEDNFKDVIHKYGPLDKLYDVYFAGGEAMFQKEHWQMLDHLVEIGRTDVMIMYTTNLTKLDYGDWKLLDYLPKFKDVTFTVSLDGTGDVFEYIRWGAKWQDIVNNLNALKNLDNVNIRFNCVPMMYNILDLPNILEFVFGQGYIQDDHQIDMSIANETYHHVGALPKELKEQAIAGIESSPYYNKLPNKLGAVVNATRELEYEFPVEYIKQMDQRRGCSISNVIPQLSCYMR